MFFFPSSNKPIDKSLSVRPFVRLMCKSLFKAPFPSIHINFKHRFGILVTQGGFLAIYGDNCTTHMEDILISVFIFPSINMPIYKYQPKTLKIYNVIKLSLNLNL